MPTARYDSYFTFQRGGPGSKAYAIPSSSAWASICSLPNAVVQFVVRKKGQVHDIVAVEEAQQPHRAPSPLKQNVHLESPPPEQPRPSQGDASQPRSSQRSGDVPATPEATDESEVEDSDVEGDSAFKARVDLSFEEDQVRLHPPSAHLSSSDGVPPDASTDRHPTSFLPTPLPISTTLSFSLPFHCSQRKQNVYTQLAKQHSARPSRLCRPATGASQVDHSPPSPSSLALPSAAQPSTSFLNRQDDGSKELQSDLDPSSSDNLRSSLDEAATEASWAVGLDSIGDVGFVDRSPRSASRKLDKDKGRAEPTPEPAEEQEEEDVDPRIVKTETRSPSRSQRLDALTSAPVQHPSSHAIKVSASQPFQTTSVSYPSAPPEAYDSSTKGLDGIARKLPILSRQSSTIARQTASPRKRAAEEVSPSRVFLSLSASDQSTSASDQSATSSNAFTASCSQSVPSKRRRRVAPHSSQPPPTGRPSAFTTSSAPSPPSQTQQSSSIPSSRNRKKAPRKSVSANYAVRLAEALARPRAEPPKPTRDGGRFRLWLRLPNSPSLHTAPCNAGPLKPTHLFQVKANTGNDLDDQYDYTIDHAMADAAEQTKWDVKDLAFTFSRDGGEKEVVYGFDRMRAGFATLREMGYGGEEGGVIDLDYAQYDPRRTVWGELDE